MPALAWLAAASAAGAFLVARAWTVFAHRRGVLDQPDARRLHRQPTPRGGGIGIALVLLAAAPWLGDGWPAFALGLLCCAGAGLWDDLRPLPAAGKLALQVPGALVLAWHWPLLPALWGLPVGIALATAGVLALVNAWNFMDGSNGLAASQALVAALAIVLLADAAPVTWLGVALAAAALGFLPLNFPQARVFLGDVGSYSLGYGVAAMLLLASASDAGQGAAWLLLLPPSALLIDAGLTLLLRAWRRERLWQAHREHLYQRAVAAGWSHAGVAALYLAWSLAASALALAATAWPAPWAGLATLSVGLVGIMGYCLLARRWPRPLIPQTPR